MFGGNGKTPCYRTFLGKLITAQIVKDLSFLPLYEI
jgi:hypothetical protein